MATSQILVKLLNGRTQCFQVPCSSVCGLWIRQSLHDFTKVPLEFIRIVTGSREIFDETVVSSSENATFPSLSFLLRLRGGKGGFGSLLRGAASKAGQKKTNNFDACRDMSGRRLRHVNAEKKLEEWRAEAEERKLEKIAVKFLKEKAKEVKQTKPGRADMYIEKYQEISQKCMEEVQASVRQSFELYQNSKRKVMPALGPPSKRIKICIEQKNELESDSEEEDEEEPVVLDGGHIPFSNGSVSRTDVIFASHLDTESSNESSRNTVEEENGAGNASLQEECGHGDFIKDAVIPFEQNLVAHSDVPKIPDDYPGGGSRTEFEGPSIHLENIEVQQKSDTTSTDTKQLASSAHDGMATFKAGVSIFDGSLTFDDFNSASDMEALGMERLKVELQIRGLKCGGTVQERAARLFLLKSMPIEEIPRKHLAKVWADVSTNEMVRVPSSVNRAK